MSIEVELFGQLLPHTKRRQSLDIKGKVSVREVADILGLNPEEVGLITINGVQSDMEDFVEPECRLCFFPYMSGG
jgi:CRISPR/Cas system type I-B associated protein Csh2 (Cas7 group RAMP superfamily)